MAAAAAPASSAKEVLPPALGAASEPPPLFDGTSRLYICYFCPFAQRAWVTRNCKGLQDKIKLAAIDLQDKPAWYKEKVYPQGTGDKKLNAEGQQISLNANAPDDRLESYLQYIAGIEEQKVALKFVVKRHYYQWIEQPAFEYTKSVQLGVGKATFQMEVQYLKGRNEG